MTGLRACEASGFNPLRIGEFESLALSGGLKSLEVHHGAETELRVQEPLNSSTRDTYSMTKVPPHTKNTQNTAGLGLNGGPGWRSQHVRNKSPSANDPLSRR